jgi:tetratricopeptide (TPR) repeat protein
MNKKLFSFIMLQLGLSVMFCNSTLFGAEGDQPPLVPPAADVPEEGRPEKKRAQRGEADKQKRRPGRQDKRPSGLPLELLNVVNAVDAVKLTLAQSLAVQKKVDKAVLVLKAIIEKSPDATAVGCAHLGLGLFYENSGRRDDAAVEFKKVKGPALIFALPMILRGKENPGQAVRSLIEESKRPEVKAMLLRKLAQIYFRDPRKLGKLADEVEELLSYQQAIKARKDELNVKMPRSNGPRRGGADGPRNVKEFKERIEQRIKELQAAGRQEEAEKLAKKLKKMLKRMEAGGRDREGKRPRPDEQPAPAEVADEF